MTAASRPRAGEAIPPDSPNCARDKPHPDAPVPLVVDVDGTLIKSDLLLEAALQMAARHPLHVWRMPVWLLDGKAALKTALTEFCDPDIAGVPLCEEVMDIIREAQRIGRPVYLASASDRRLVERLAERIGGTEGVFGTDGSINLSGNAKAARLVAEFGAGNFDYVGNADVDFPIWQAARKVYALTPGQAFEKRLLKAFPEAEVVARPRPTLKAFLRALRPHQWSKNALIFLPLIAGHHFQSGPLIAATLAFICFSLAASSAYLINDLLDLPADRDHPRKRGRPFAAGDLDLRHGLALAILLMGAAVLLAWTLPIAFTLTLLLYVCGTLAYSLFLKRKPVVDVVTLAGLYTLRVLAGVTVIAAAQYTPWMLIFSLFFFLALAVVKRCSELIARVKEGKPMVLGRGYRSEDLHVLLSFGAAAGYGSILVVTLYLASPEVRALYTYPGRLWLMTPILMYWITRMFIYSNRGELHDDPLVFALTDRTSWLCGACVLGIIALAL